VPFRIVIASPQGGTGRTALAAQLAGLLSAGGKRCLAIDFDPQNMLGLWLGGNPSAWISGQSGGRAALSVLNFELGPNALANSLRDRRALVPHVPFGSRDQLRPGIGPELVARVDALRARLGALEPSSCQVVVLDTPSGENVYSEAALSIADLVLVPLRADASSLATLPRYESYLRSVCPRVFPSSVHYVLSMFDPARPLACDSADALSHCAEGCVIPRVIHDDETVREQFARGTPLELDPSAQAFHDYAWIASYVTRALERSQASASAHAS
jgi:chromosome partitioning protein